MTISNTMIFLSRPTLAEVLTWVDVETLTLLFSMMVIVSVISETGLFNYMGFWAFKVTKGKVFIVCLVITNYSSILLYMPIEI